MTEIKPLSPTINRKNNFQIIKDTLPAIPVKEELPPPQFSDPSITTCGYCKHEFSDQRDCEDHIILRHIDDRMTAQEWLSRAIVLMKGGKL